MLSEMKTIACSETRVYATSMFVVDTGMLSEGKNFGVSSPKMKILQPNTTWNLSGNSAVCARDTDKAANGSSPGASGTNGKHGEQGEGGGNVSIFCDEIEGANNLKIISNGGKGGDGQDGGDGCNGENGDNGLFLNCKTANDFKLKLGPLQTLEQLKPFISKLTPLTVSYNDSSRLLFLKSDVYVEGTYSGMKTNLIHYRYRLNWGFRTLVLVKGLQGTDGSRGGDAGAGGARGEGGYPGKLEIGGMQESHCKERYEIITEMDPGEDGIEGKPGKPGNGGRNGNRGADCGRVEADKETFVYFGSLELYSDPNEHKKRVWTGKKMVYYGIRTVGTWPPQDVFQNNGKKASKKSNMHQKVRKRLMVKKELVEEMKKTMRNSPHAKVAALFQQEQKGQLENEDNANESEVSKSHRFQAVPLQKVKQEANFNVPRKRNQLEKNNLTGWPPLRGYIIRASFTQHISRSDKTYHNA